MSAFIIAFIVSLSAVIPSGAPVIWFLPVLDPEAWTLRKSVSFGPSL